VVENQNVHINLIYNCVIAGFIRGQPSRCAIAQGPPPAVGATTNPNKCITYPRTLYPKANTLAWTKLHPDFNLDRLFPARFIPGVKAAQARLYPAILWPGPIYTLGYIMA